MGLSAWHKANTKNELLQEAQVLNFKLARDVELSAIQSVSGFPAPPPPDAAHAVAFLSPRDANGKVVVDSYGHPEFQKYIVYYHDNSEKTVYRKEVPLVPGASERGLPAPIDTYNNGGGAMPLASYRTGGRPIARFVDEFNVEIRPEPANQLWWEVVVERKRFGSQRPESITTNSAAYLRN